MDRDDALALIREHIGGARGRRDDGWHVTIVGPMPLDEIALADGSRQLRYGGALYTLAAYARLAEGTANRVSFVSHVAPEDLSYLQRLFGDDPGVDLGGVTAREGDGTRIELIYSDRQRRRSRQQCAMSPIAPADLRPFLDSDAFILLPLTADELAPTTLGQLRRDTNGFILLDAHGPLTRLEPDGNRRRVPWEEAERSLRAVDMLKMNRDEARVFFGDLSWPDGYALAASRLLALGPQVIWLTQGDQSSVVVFVQGGRAGWASVPTVTGIGAVRETTGCGDAAAAGFIFAYLRSGLPLLSAAAGNTVGSLKAVHPSGLDLPEVWQVRDLVRLRYGDFLHALVEDFLQQTHVMVRWLTPQGAGRA